MQVTIEDIRVGFWGDWIILRQENGKLELEHIMTGERKSVEDPTWVDAPVMAQAAPPPPWVKEANKSGCAINKIREYMRGLQPPVLPSDMYTAEMWATLERYRQFTQDMIRLSPHPPWIAKNPFEPPAPPDSPEETGKNPA